MTGQLMTYSNGRVHLTNPKDQFISLLSKVQNFRRICPGASMSDHIFHVGRPHMTHSEYIGIIHNTNLLKLLKMYTELLHSQISTSLLIMKT